jgi:predicted RNase H-like HicB family nuclease
MTTDLEKRAKKLASRPYSVEYIEDETTNGEPVIVASHPELYGCIAQGKTLREALKELADARREYILSLLEDGLPVPQPLERKIGDIVTTRGTQGTWNVIDVKADIPAGGTDEDDQQKPTTISIVKS